MDKEGGGLGACVGAPVHALQRTCSRLAAQFAMCKLAGSSCLRHALLQCSISRAAYPLLCRPVREKRECCVLSGRQPPKPTAKLVPRLTAAHTVLQAASIIPADSNSLAYLRTVAEVTNIVSGFFPAGLSGL